MGIPRFQPDSITGITLFMQGGNAKAQSGSECPATQPSGTRSMG